MFETLIGELEEVHVRHRRGRVVAADSGALTVAGLESDARLGDGILVGEGDEALEGEIVALGPQGVRAMTYAPIDGLALGAPAVLRPLRALCPGPGWLGRVIDAFGRPLDGRPLPPGPAAVALRRTPP
ncbi:MAG: flagellum-specific ATP synthase FliI, partial [Alphaproteobacteria bacterium]